MQKQIIRIMGMFDTVIIPCPSCGEGYEAQSKGGECDLEVYTFDDCPDDVMSDINRHAPFHCECGATFRVKLEPRIIKIMTPTIERIKNSDPE